VYPWTPLDEHHFGLDTFKEIDVLVLSLGRWFPHWDEEKYGTRDIERKLIHYMTELRKVYSGRVIYQSEYAEHEVGKDGLSMAVNCSHSPCADCGETISHCSYRTWEALPPRHALIRNIMTQFQVVFIDRWKISETLPHSYFELWYCGMKNYHPWFCDHHLHFVGLLHMQLVTNVLQRLNPFQAVDRIAL